VDIWHCNASGVYSNIAAQNATGRTFLRGYQPTDRHGNVYFLTIYRGCCQAEAERANPVDRVEFQLVYVSLVDAFNTPRSGPVLSANRSTGAPKASSIETYRLDSALSFS